MSDPLGPPAGPSGPAAFERGPVWPGLAAGCALPIVGILLAILLSLGLVVWSGVR